MTTLDRAFTLTDRPHGAVLIGEHLHLDVMAGGQIALAENRRIAERGLRLALGGGDFAWQIGQFPHHPHTAAATTGRRFHQHWQLIGRHGRRVELGEYRDAGRGHHLLGLDLGAHGPHRIDRRADPGQPGFEHRGREIRVFRQEPVAGMDRVGAGGLGGRDDLGGVEVAVVALEPHPHIGLGDVWGPGVGVGVDGDRPDPETAAGGEHPAGDFPAVGDQNSLHFPPPPKLRFVAGFGANVSRMRSVGANMCSLTS